MRAIETHEVGNIHIKIYPDETGDHECPLSTLEKDEGIIFASFERNSTLNEYNPFKDGPEAVKFADENDYEWFYLFKYDHSVVAFSARTFVGRAQHAEWDSGSIGLILIKRTPTWDDTTKRHEVAEAWCKSLTTWVNGWYYGYVAEDAQGNHLDSCWGYDDMAYCIEEAKMSAQYHANKAGVK